MKTKFFISGSNVNVFRMNEETVLDTLDPKIYTVAHDPMAGFYLEINKDQLETPRKIYGIAKARTNKCIQTYKDRNSSLGILLTGDKGTGKSLQMALLANQAIKELNLPVILIKQPFAGAAFTSFIENIGECCLVFDEFGKMYTAHNNKKSDRDIPQKELLTLLDGIDKTKRMVIMTENNVFDINDFILNRPSRIYYHFRYEKLEEESIQGYCKDLDVSELFIKDLIDLSRRSFIFSFDMLQSIVEEHLRFDESVDVITRELNIDTASRKKINQTVTKVIRVSTGESVPILGFDISDDEIYVKLLGERTNEAKSSVSDLLAEVDFEDASTNPNQYFHLNCYFHDSLVYHTKDIKVYETGDFQIYVKTTKAQTTNYSLVV